MLRACSVLSDSVSYGLDFGSQRTGVWDLLQNPEAPLHPSSWWVLNLPKVHPAHH